jgi:2-dehydro-3-deoxy-D-arabinonate dehydratase
MTTSQTARLCRFVTGPQQESRIGLVDGATVRDLTAAGVGRLDDLLERVDLSEQLAELRRASLPRLPLEQVRLLTPVESQEVWAAGVTYLRSKQARMEESDFSARAYDHVYEAVRPEIFFKSFPHKVVASGEAVGIRQDARWSVPEPELALVIDHAGRVVGFSVGNDMSSRDIEGENLLYLPQAKIYSRSCAIGPWIVVGPSEEEARQWAVRLEIERAGQVAFDGQTTVGQLKRTFDELVAHLFRSQVFPFGAVLLTGAGIVPDDTFTLNEGDAVRITISGIGTLENRVVVV